MATEDALLAYIKKEEDKGFDEPTIRNALLKAGYQQAMINKVFSDYKANSVPATPEVIKEEPKSAETTKEEKPVEEPKEKAPEEHKKISKIYWIMLIIIFLLLCGAGFIYVQMFYLDSGNAMGDTSQTTEEPTAPVKKSTSLDALNFCEGVVKKSISQCRDIEDKDLKGECLYYLSLFRVLDKGGVSSCYYNSKPSFKSICLYTAKEDTTNCRTYCSVVSANLGENYKSCPSDKPFCTSSLAIWKAVSTKDASICSSFRDGTKKALCLTMVADDVAMCDG